MARPLPIGAGPPAPSGTGAMQGQGAQAAQHDAVVVFRAAGQQCWVPEYSGLKRRVCPTFPADGFSVIQ